MTRLERLRSLNRRARSSMTPSLAAWQGAGTGIALLSVAVTVFYFASYFLQDFALQKLPAYLVQVGSLMLAGALALGVLKLLNSTGSWFRWGLFVFAPFVVLVLPQGNESASLLSGGALVFIAALVGAAIGVLRRSAAGWRDHKAAVSVLVLGLGGLAAGLYVTFSTVDEPNPWLDAYEPADRTLRLPNPGLPGDYEVRTLSYGSGKDRHRPAFGEDADLVARSVDASKLIDNWDGLSGWLRSSYWGFGVDALPLQARTWYPAGSGPFPLVLIVHGNHSMEDYSDPGYAWLGELLASRGIILASVDENFINSSMSARVELFADRPGLKEENDARGWLLLQHLAQWRDWNDETGHYFDGKVDMDRVALIGHSRGGEAVGIAAAFNDLSRYPDDATLEFDFGFKLRGVIAIAPVDGQYKPRDSGTPIRDVNYFTIHGSMDGDVQSFDGTAQYSRVRFSGDEFRFRSSLYVEGANHGQFNTTWGKLDTSLFRAWALDLSRLMDGEAQRDVARVYFSAFLEVVLNGRDEYLPMFGDAAYAANWLPQRFYINQYSDSRYRAIADFEEDADPTTLTIDGGRLVTTNLSRWYEVRNEIKYDELDTHAAVFAWDDRIGSDAPRVDLAFPAGSLPLGPAGAITLSLADLGIDTLPTDFDGERGEPAPPAPVAFAVEIVDGTGESARLPLPGLLYPPVKALPRRAGFLEREDATEVLFQRYLLPVAAFLAENPALDTRNLAGIGLVFDQSPRGAVIVDDVHAVP